MGWKETDGPDGIISATYGDNVITYAEKIYNSLTLLKQGSDAERHWSHELQHAVNALMRHYRVRDVELIPQAKTWLHA